MLENESIESRRFSVQDVERIQKLLTVTRELVEWDLGSKAETSEEIDMVLNAKSAMKEFEKTFGLAKTKSYIEEEKPEHIQQPPTELVLNPDELEKLRANFSAVSELMRWDIADLDGEGMSIILNAKEAWEDLKDII